MGYTSCTEFYTEFLRVFFLRATPAFLCGTLCYTIEMVSQSCAEFYTELLRVFLFLRATPGFPLWYSEVSRYFRKLITFFRWLATGSGLTPKKRPSICRKAFYKQKAKSYYFDLMSTVFASPPPISQFTSILSELIPSVSTR